jgi:transposase
LDEGELIGGGAMPRPYSGDLRSRVLTACDEGEPPSRVAQRFRIARASAYSWLKQRRDEGRCTPKRIRGTRKPLIREAVETALKRLVDSDNHLTLTEYRDRLAHETGTRVHPWTVGRALQRLRLTRKKEDAARHRAGRDRGRQGTSGLVR